MIHSAIKTCLILFAITPYAKTLTAQEVVCSELFRSERDVKAIRIAGYRDDVFYVIDENQKEKTLRLTAYSQKQVSAINSQKIQLQENEMFESIHFHASKFFLFTSKRFDKEKKIEVNCTQLDKTGKPLAESKSVHQISYNNTSNLPEFGVVFSPDSTKMLLYFDPPYERKSTEALSFRCYSSQLESIWQKDILLPYTQEIVQVHHFLLDNDGDLYMMSGRNPIKDSKLWQKPQGARYVVFYYNGKANKLKEYDISLKDKQVLSVSFGLNPNQDVIITGYYSNDFRFNASGTIQFTIGAHGSAMKTAIYMPFSKEFIEEFMDSDDAEKNPSLPDFYLDQSLIEKNGDVILIGEQYYVSQNTITDPATGRQTIEYRYNFDEIILTKTDSTGKHLWNKKIPKRQFTITDTRNCSYLCYSAGDSLLFYFNDDPDNTVELSQNPDQNLRAFIGSKSSVTTSVSVHPDGQMQRKTLFSNKEKDALLNTFYSQKYMFGPQLLGYEDGKNFRFCLVH